MAAPSNWLGRPFARALIGHACHSWRLAFFVLSPLLG